MQRLLLELLVFVLFFTFCARVMGASCTTEKLSALVQGHVSVAYSEHLQGKKVVLSYRVLLCGTLGEVLTSLYLCAHYSDSIS